MSDALGYNVLFDPGGDKQTAEEQYPEQLQMKTDIPESQSRQPMSGDGTVDRVLKRKGKPVTAIFIHAGAGFHSHQNERVHLEACSDAAAIGMRFLKAGSSAIDAVVAALRLLEDREITNAGYGSNLAIDGTVECDATVVDHLGRSGACGAVPNIRNPVALAKLVLERSMKPLSLRRVPPNILVGDGATSFAKEHGMSVVPNEKLVSRNARDRFEKWIEDLKRASGQPADNKSRPVSQGLPSPPTVECQYESATSVTLVESRTGKSGQPDHTNAILTGVWNEGQPDSPYHGTPDQGSPAPTEYVGSVHGVNVTPSSSHGSHEMPGAFSGTSDRAGSPKKIRLSARHENDNVLPSYASVLAKGVSSDAGHMPHRDGSASPRGHRHENGTPGQLGVPRVAPDCGFSRGTKRTSADISHDNDLIVDTIGAIAIDDRGHIAAASSSGGIGMKHRGRLGPAALVRVGTAVVPLDPKDVEGKTVAAVTSGTGEHMATTMASQRCAERIFYNTRQGPTGRDIHEDDEDAIMESFVTDDFMNHPGVKNSPSAGAIGVMAVKKTQGAIYLFFAHNTDSFALSSMASTDTQPLCLMSRLGDDIEVTRGARRIRLDPVARK